MPTESSYHFDHLLQVSKKSIWILILYTFFNVFPHVYSPGAGADNPLWTKFWCQQKGLVTLPICCKFQKNIFEVWFYTYFCQFLYMYIAPGQGQGQGQGQTSPWGQNFYFNINLLSLVICCKFLLLNDFLTVFPKYKSIKDQIWPCCKTGQGQPRVIIWTNYDGPRSPILHTKPQGYWPFGSGEEDCWRVLTIYGHGAHVGHVTQTTRPNFRSPTTLRPRMKFGFDRPNGFGEEDLWKWWMTDRRRTMAKL